MKKHLPRNKVNQGLSIIEVLIGLLIIMLTIMGTLSIRYASTGNIVEAERRQAAIHLSKMILEGWYNSKNLNYSITTEFGNYYSITTSTTGPSLPSGFTKRGNYKIALNQVTYSVTMSYKAQTTDVPAILNVQISWPATGKSNLTRSCSLTTYMTL